MTSLPAMIGTALIVSTDSIPFDVVVVYTDISLLGPAFTVHTS